MVLLLVGAGLASTPADWARTPVATDLHPVGHSYGVEWQKALSATMGGPRASPAFGAVVAEADVHWRLLQSGDTGLPIGPDTAENWRATATAGALIALNRVVDDTVSRSSEFTVFRGALDAVVNPSLRVQKREDGITVQHRTGGAARTQVERTEMDLGFIPPERRPAMDVGVHWRLRDEDASPKAPLLDYAAYVSLARFGFTSFRAEVLALTGSWTVTAREEVYPRVALAASLRSLDPAENPRTWLANATPGRWSVGVVWTPLRAPGWSLRLDRITTIPTEDVTWQISVRGEMRTPIPAQLDPALGWRPLSGEALPAIPDRSPLAVALPGMQPERISAGCAARCSPGTR